METSILRINQKKIKHIDTSENRELKLYMRDTYTLCPKLAWAIQISRLQPYKNYVSTC